MRGDERNQFVAKILHLISSIFLNRFSLHRLTLMTHYLTSFLPTFSLQNQIKPCKCVRGVPRIYIDRDTVELCVIDSWNHSVHYIMSMKLTSYIRTLFVATDSFSTNKYIPILAKNKTINTFPFTRSLGHLSIHIAQSYNLRISHTCV